MLSRYVDLSDTPSHQMFRASAGQNPFTFLKTHQIMGSFDEMPVTVAFLHCLLVFFTPEHERKLVLSLHGTAQRDMARPLAWVVAWYARLEGERHTDVASRTLSRTHIARILTRIPLKTKQFPCRLSGV